MPVIADFINTIDSPLTSLVEDVLVVPVSVKGPVPKDICHKMSVKGQGLSYWSYSVAVIAAVSVTYCSWFSGVRMSKYGASALTSKLLLVPL